LYYPFATYYTLETGFPVATRRAENITSEGGTMTAYRIRLKEKLDQRWSTWLGGLKMIHEANGETVLAGEVVDQAALHGLLSKVRDLQLTLISVSPLEVDSPSKEEIKEKAP